jgi:hypothetical protein
MFEDVAVTALFRSEIACGARHLDSRARRFSLPGVGVPLRPRPRLAVDLKLPVEPDDAAFDASFDEVAEGATTIGLVELLTEETT